MKTRYTDWLWALCISAALLLVCSKSSPLYLLNDWMDANIFFTTGKAMFSGRVLYRDVFDHKGPLLYALYGLGWLLHRTGFTGVWLLEVASFTAFLSVSQATVRRLTGPLHPGWMLVPAAALLGAPMLAHGGSAEEFCLPLLAVGLWGMAVLWQSQRPLSLAAVLVQGAAAGCLLWLKYTALGFCLVWVAAAAVLYARRGWLKTLPAACGAYLLGMGLATLPWLAYFVAHGALDSLWEVYFYDNLFLYAGQGGGPAALLQRLWWIAHDNPLPVLLFAAALLWALATGRRGLLALWAALAAGLAVTSLSGGGYLVYYGLVLGVFAPLGLVPLVKAWRNTAPRAALRRAAPAAAAALALVWCLWQNPNTARLGRKAEELPQLRFAQQIGGGTLLNYGTLDGGFYTASGAMPPCRFFCITNMPLPGQQQQQDALLETAAVEYVVALDGALDSRFPAYERVDEAAYDSGEGPRTWYLYRRIDLFA